MREKMPVICPTSQAECLRHVGTTGKSLRATESLSSPIVIPEAAPRLSGIHRAARMLGGMDSGPAPFAQTASLFVATAHPGMTT
jgi:hypothetical protein